MLKTNIIYLTTRCNFRCEYCYERAKRETEGFKHKDVTEEEIDEFLREIEQRERGYTSTVVIMGGEPTLRFDMFKYLVEKMITSNHQYSCLITTNGSRLDDDTFYNEFKDLVSDARNRGLNLTIEISYDGSGQFRRRFADGKPSDDVVRNVLSKLERDGVTFRVSYSVHKGNYDKLLEDTVKLFESYPKSLEGIKYSFAYQELDEVGKELDIDNFGFKLEEYYRPKVEQLYNIYKKLLCSLACNVCKRCNKSLFDGNRYLSPTKGIFEKPKYVEEEFSQF